MERTLAEILVQENVLSREELDDAFRAQEASGGAPGTILLERTQATEWEMAAAIGKKMNIPFIMIQSYDVDPEVIETVPDNFARHYQLLPVDRTGDTLTVLTADATNILALDELRMMTRYTIVPVLGFESDVVEAIEKYYGSEDCQVLCYEIVDVPTEHDIAEEVTSRLSVLEKVIESGTLRLEVLCRVFKSIDAGIAELEEAESPVNAKAAQDAAMDFRSKRTELRNLVSQSLAKVADNWKTIETAWNTASRLWESEAECEPAQHIEVKAQLEAAIEAIQWLDKENLLGRNEADLLESQARRLLVQINEGTIDEDAGD